MTRHELRGHEHGVLKSTRLQFNLRHLVAVIMVACQVSCTALPARELSVGRLQSPEVPNLTELRPSVPLRVHIGDVSVQLSDEVAAKYGRAPDPEKFELRCREGAQAPLIAASWVEVGDGGTDRLDVSVSAEVTGLSYVDKSATSAMGSGVYRADGTKFTKYLEITCDASLVARDGSSSVAQGSARLLERFPLESGFDLEGAVDAAISLAGGNVDDRLTALILKNREVREMSVAQIKSVLQGVCDAAACDLGRNWAAARPIPDSDSDPEHDATP